MDRWITDHLEQSKAVVPRPNPAFDPAQYRPERIGQQPGGLKVGGDDNPKAANKGKKTNFADFISTCERKWEVGGNTGVMFRAGRTAGKKGAVLWRNIKVKQLDPISPHGHQPGLIQMITPSLNLRFIVATGLVVCVHFGRANTSPIPGTPWPATDALSRSMPHPASVPPARADRFVGVFCFLTHGRDIEKLPNDISKILPLDPNILRKPDSPLWGQRGPYYWGQPLYGYYDSRDPWVIRRHANLLADAGVDVVIFDTTNRETYPEVYMEICKGWSQILKEGGLSPRLCFMVNTKAGETAEELYRELYQPGLFPELWFHWQGKPLLICDPEKASDAVKQFFTLRRAHWPFSMENTHNAWYWEATHPQPYSFDADPSKPEQVNVSVAQNLHKDKGHPVNMSSGNAPWNSTRRL